MAFLDKKITELQFISTPGNDDRIAIVNLGVTKQTSVSKFLQSVVADTGSFVENATITDNVITFTRADGTTFTATMVSRFVDPVSSPAANTFSVTHGLDVDYPIVQSYDNNNLQVIPDSVEIINNNRVDVTFADAFTGNIVVQK